MSQTAADDSVQSTVKGDASWRALVPRSYRVLREHSIERAAACTSNRGKPRGPYQCVGSRATLFASAGKLCSGARWPSVEHRPAKVAHGKHRPFVIHRAEVPCTCCGGHLGHAFPDGSRATTGPPRRVYGVVLKFNPEDG